MSRASRAPHTQLFRIARAESAESAETMSGHLGSDARVLPTASPDVPTFKGTHDLLDLESGSKRWRDGALSTPMATALRWPVTSSKNLTRRPGAGTIP